MDIYWSMGVGSSTYFVAKVVALNLFPSFLKCFPSIYSSSNYCASNSCHSFRLLKLIAKSNWNLFVATTIVIVIVGRAIPLQRVIKKRSKELILKRKQRTDIKKEAKKIKSNNFTGSKREKSNVAIASIAKWMYMISFFSSASVMDIYWSMGVGATTYFADENALKVYLDITF